ncbi:hypothetical protein CANINC_000259 [Pichia inconspicua]|uniref:Uncharacterized protein n=1 Tax=Pichia inconspicua TaxID=52247 RepID=A0A4T0X6L8_9ASCO|nr:hypothetical protein CANINC_000259 [[Candida] inconspicua]
MKISFLNIFSKRKDQPLETHSDLRLNLKKISKQREIPIVPPKLNQQKIRRTSSLSNVKETFNRIRRSSSVRRLNIKHHNAHILNKSKIIVSQYPEDLDSSIPEEIDNSGDISIFDQVRTSSLNSSSFINITPDNSDYTDYYNNLYSHYCNDISDEQNETNSAITSLDWNKENLPPFNYPLSASKTPNFSITPRTPKPQQLSQFSDTENPFLNTENPFLDTENPFLDTNMLTPLHRHFLYNEENYPPLNSGEKEILYYTSNASTSCDSTPSNCLKRRHSFLKSSPPPRITIPALPKFDTRTPVSARSVNLLNNLSTLANDSNVFEIDNEERSLLEALSSTELISCSKVNFITYNR